MFSPTLENGKIILPPKNKKDDIDKLDDSYGCKTYTKCGEEIEFIQKLPSIPFLPLLNKSIKDIVKYNNEIIEGLN